MKRFLGVVALAAVLAVSGCAGHRTGAGGLQGGAVTQPGTTTSTTAPAGKAPAITTTTGTTSTSTSTATQLASINQQLAQVNSALAQIDGNITAADKASDNDTN